VSDFTMAPDDVWAEGAEIAARSLQDHTSLHQTLDRTTAPPRDHENSLKLGLGAQGRRLTDRAGEASLGLGRQIGDRPRLAFFIQGGQAYATHSFSTPDAITWSKRSAIAPA